MNNKKGFSTILGLIILLIICGGAYYFISASKVENTLGNTNVETGEQTQTETTTKNVNLPPTGYMLTGMENFAFKLPDGWGYNETPNEITLKSLKKDLTEGDRISIKYVVGTKYESFDSKFGPFGLEKMGDSYIVERPNEGTVEISKIEYTQEQLNDLQKINGRPVFLSNKRWKTYIIATENGFIELNISGGGDTEALDELVDGAMFVSG